MDLASTEPRRPAALPERRVRRPAHRPGGRPPDGKRPAGSPRGRTAERVLRFVLVAAALLAVGALVWYFSWLVFYLTVGGVLAYLMKPLVEGLRGVGLPPVAAIAVTFVVVFGGLILLVAALAPFVIRQVGDLSQQLTLETITGAVQVVEDWLVVALPLYERGALAQGLEETADALFRDVNFTTTVGSVVNFFTSFVYAALIIPFVTFFFLKDGVLLQHSVLRWVPNRYFEITLTIWDQVGQTLGRYLRALVVQCTLVAAVASALLYLTGLNYALAVGLFAGLANSIPYFGPVVGFVAGTVVGIAQTGDLSMVPAVFVAMGFTQLIDNLFFHPLIFSRAAQAHPLIILVVVLVGAQLGGIVGMLVAIPVATTLRVIVEQVTWSLRNYQIVRAGR